MSAGEGGAVVWEGRSRFDREAPIAVALTWHTQNTKIGPMVQSWILRSDIPPTVVLRTGADRAVCGDCERSGGDGCYVKVHNAPLSVFKTLPHYPRISPEVAARRLTGQRLRIGAYGDPAAVVASLWWALTRETSGHTGYTHSPDRAPALRDLVMASADTVSAAERWQAHKWRTYRVRSVARDGTPEPLEPGEVVCPASSEGGKRSACAWCLLCDGSSKPGKSIAVIDHSGVTASRVARLLTLRRSMEGAALVL